MCEPPPVAQSPTATPVVLHFERTSCYGTCPVYNVDLSAAGVVTFEGIEHVAARGRFVWWLSPARVAAIRELFAAARFFELADHYLAGTDCKEYSTDSPSVTISATIDGRTKTVEHYHGCYGAPRGLGMLESTIDFLLGTLPWVDTER